MSFLQKISPEWALRLGLGLTYLYSGYDIATHPTAWSWAIRGLPQVVQNLIGQIGVETFLRVQGVVEILFALVLLAWFLPKKLVRAVALLIGLEMLLILLFVGIDAVTFRDIGLLGGALALFVLMRASVSNEKAP